MPIIEERVSKKLGRKYCWRVQTEEAGGYKQKRLECIRSSICIKREGCQKKNKI
jgi:hypothetical protein